MNFVSYLFEASAASPREFILGHGTAPMSHAALWERVRGLAAALAERGRGRNYLLLAPNGPYFVTCYLATMLSGNVALPLEPRISRRELQEVVELSTPEGVFVDEAQREKWYEIRSTADVLTEARLPRAAGEPGKSTGDDEIAVILFTSGTTGGRKGVLLSHGNLRANTDSILAFLNLDATDAVLVALPFSYCYGASLLHTHLRVGGSVVLSNSISLGAVIQELKRYRCTGLAGVPSTYQILANKTDFLQHDFPALRYMTQSGAKLSDPLIRRFAEAFDDKEFYVMYGATEATARLSYLPPHLLESKRGSIGKGIPGVTLEVRNEAGRQVRPGETGEIVASGANIMQGYYKDLEATAAALRGGSLFTGDLATVDEDGFIYVVGRSKQIIKSAGHRIAPVEVESVILTVDGVDDCKVFGAPDELLGEAVIAVVESYRENDAVVEEIAGRCRRELPSFMQPQRVEIVEALPLTASKKVDVTRLLELIR